MAGDAPGTASGEQNGGPTEAAAFAVHTQSSFTNARLEKLAYQEWLPLLPTKPPVGALIFHHGIAAYSQNGIDLFECLVPRGIACFGIDARSHGRSDGLPRAQVDKFSFFVDDFEQFAGLVAKRMADIGVPDAPIFCCGHSMGGLVAALTVARDPARWMKSGLILLAPAIDVERTMVLKMQEPFASCLACLTPDWRMVPAVHRSAICRIEQETINWEKDPLNSPGQIRARIAYNTLLAFSELASSPPCTCPLLIVHGLADKVTYPKASKAYCDRATTPDKTFLGLPEAYHNLFREPEPDRSTFLSSTRDWVLARCPAAVEEETRISRLASVVSPSAAAAVQSVGSSPVKDGEGGASKPRLTVSLEAPSVGAPVAGEGGAPSGMGPSSGSGGPPTSEKDVEITLS